MGALQSVSSPIIMGSDFAYLFYCRPITRMPIGARPARLANGMSTSCVIPHSAWSTVFHEAGSVPISHGADINTPVAVNTLWHTSAPRFCVLSVVKFHI